jgi:RNA polymerase sigma factor (sigma-70 family)
MILCLCRRLQCNEHDAEDVFQATFLLLARKAGSIRKYEAVASWLYGVAYRLALAARSQGARRQARERQAADMRKEPALPGKAWQELQATLEGALREVPEIYRAPLLLCYLEGQTQETAAQQLGCPLGTVRSRLARGRERLKTILERKGVRLSATALAAAWAGSVVDAALPPLLVTATVKAALDYAGGAAVAALVSQRVATLVDSGARAMAAAKLKIATALVFLSAVVGLGVSAAAELFGSTQVPEQPGAYSTSARDILGNPPPATAQDVPAPAPATAGPQAKRAGADAKVAQAAKDRPIITIQGQVLDPKAKPVAGAKLYVSRATRVLFYHEDLTVEPVGATDADGRFSLSLDGQERGWFYLIAHAPGFGVSWIHLDEEKRAGDVTLNLVEDVPITGRVVNTEGKPVPGVSVSINSIYDPGDEKLDGYLSGWLTTTMPEYYQEMPENPLYAPLAEIAGRATTDQNGDFVLRGAGAERIVHVTFTGAGTARSTPYVITRPGIDPGPYNKVLAKNKIGVGTNRFYPPTLTFVAEHGRTVQGVVKDIVTGQPVPGCRLYVYTPGFLDGMSVLSDAAGRYRIDGVSNIFGSHTVSVKPPPGSPYLNRSARAPGSADRNAPTAAVGLTPVTLDIELAKGVVVTGQVLDRQTGKGVQAGIRLAPLPDNRFVESRAEYRTNRTTAGTDKDGRFRLLTVPGKTVILAQARRGEKLPPYRRAVPDPNHKDLFTYAKESGSWFIKSFASTEFLGVENDARVLDLPESGATEVELYFDRGVTGQIAIQDDEGQPLAGAWVAGLTEHWPITHQVMEPTATVLALTGDQPRTLVLFHAAKKLGGTVTIRGDEKEPVVARLAPLGSVTARFVDADGNPLAGATIEINADDPASELYRFANPIGKRVVTDKDGRFHLPGVVPGVSFFLQTRLGDSWYRGRPKIGRLQAKPGETIDLGQRTLEKLEPE